MKRYLTFRIGGSGFVLPADAIAEIVDLEALQPLPLIGKPDLVGLAPVRGRFVPVVDLPGAWCEENGEVERERDSAPVLLVLGRGRRRLGLRVGRAGEVVEADVERPAGRGDAPVVRLDGELVRYLDPDALLAGEDSILPEGVDAMEDSREKPEEKVRIVTLRIGPEDFGIDVMDVFEVLRVPKVRTVPRAPEFVEGVTDVRGEVVPIIDLRKRFSVPATGPGPEARLLIVEMEEKRVGLIVDGVPGVAEFPAGAVKPPPDLFRGLEARYLDGIVRDDDRLILLLDVEEVLSSDERIELRSLMDEEIEDLEEPGADSRPPGVNEGPEGSGRRKQGRKKKEEDA